MKYASLFLATTLFFAGVVTAADGDKPKAEAKKPGEMRGMLVAKPANAKPGRCGT